MRSYDRSLKSVIGKKLTLFCDCNNMKLIAKTLKVAFLSVIGLAVSAKFVAKGAEMMVSSGIPIETLYPVAGPFYCGAGITMFLYFITVSPLKIFKILTTDVEQ